MDITNISVDDYIDSLDETLRGDIAELHKQILSRMPKVKAQVWQGVFWGGSEQRIIGYGDFSYTRSDKKIVKWFMVGLAQQKNYISVYVNATEDKQYLVKKYQDKLGKVKTGSASVSFKKLSDINIEELLKLVDKSYNQISKA